jgi:hypothetical protein
MKGRMQDPEYKRKIYENPERKRKLSIALHNNMMKLSPEERSAKGKASNRMFDPAVRKKVSQTLQKIHHKPKIQGGNGRGFTVPQSILLDKLGDGWFGEHVVCTGKCKGYPNHYKIDIANPELMVAIEVDGLSHQALSVKAKDKKKQEKLESLGWKVLRVSNKEVLNTLDTVIQKVSSISGT